MIRPARGAACQQRLRAEGGLDPWRAVEEALHPRQLQPVVAGVEGQQPVKSGAKSPISGEGLISWRYGEVRILGAGRLALFVASGRRGLLVRHAAQQSPKGCGRRPEE